jgi:hypothetical protein
MARYFNEYLIFGGYPRIVIEAEHDKKVSYLMDIYNSYVKKDIKDIMRIDNITAFNNLLCHHRLRMDPPTTGLRTHPVFFLFTLKALFFSVLALLFSGSMWVHS